jgi:hypothetical protein
MDYFAVVEACHDPVSLLVESDTGPAQVEPLGIDMLRQQTQ